MGGLRTTQETPIISYLRNLVLLPPWQPKLLLQSLQYIQQAANRIIAALSPKMTKTEPAAMLEMVATAACATHR